MARCWCIFSEKTSTTSEVLTKDVVCCLVKNLESNIEMWIKVIEEENGLNKTNEEADDITTDVSQNNNSFMIALMVFLSVTVVIVINLQF